MAHTNNDSYVGGCPWIEKFNKKTLGLVGGFCFFNDMSSLSYPSELEDGKAVKAFNDGQIYSLR